MRETNDLDYPLAFNLRIGMGRKKGTRTCDVPDCTRHHVARGFCSTHYQADNRRIKEVIPRESKVLVCAVDGCDRAHRAKGFCVTHYGQNVKYGEIIPVPVLRRPVKKECLSVGCEKMSSSKGYCGKHYSFMKRRGEFGGKACKIDDCDVLATCKGLCSRHYDRLKRYGTTDLQPPKFRLAGGYRKKLDPDQLELEAEGFVYLNCDEQSALQEMGVRRSGEL